MEKRKHSENIRKKIIDTPENILQKYGSDILSDPKYLRCASFRHHRTSNCMEHCINVALKAIEMAIARSMEVDVSSLVRGCLLHDYYLYEFTATPKFGHFHCHGVWAMRNAERDFGLNKREKNMIKCHMWPIRIWSVPASREAWLLCFADKKVGGKEIVSKKHPEKRVAE